MPVFARKHLSKADATFIVAAYAIPIPGTALIAIAVVGGKIGYRHLRRRLKPVPTLDAYNG